MFKNTGKQHGPPEKGEREEQAASGPGSRVSGELIFSSETNRNHSKAAIHGSIGFLSVSRGRSCCPVLGGDDRVQYGGMSQ